MDAVTKIRLATLEDAVEIARMSQANIEYGLPWRYTPARIARAIGSTTTNVAVVRDKAGLVAFGIMRYADEAAHLQLFAVRNSCRRRGVGSALLAWLEEVARTAGILTISLETRKENAPARAFYRKHGYQEGTHVLGMYFGIEDGVCLEKALSVSPRPGAIASIQVGPPMNIAEVVKDSRVRFLRYRQGLMYYTISIAGRPDEYMFPVPLDGIGEVTLQAEEKALVFTRFIRKAMEEGTFVRVGNRHIRTLG